MLFLLSLSLSLTRKTVKSKTDLFSAPRAEVHQCFLGNTFSNSLHTLHTTHADGTYSSVQAPHKALTFDPKVITQHTHTQTTQTFVTKLTFCKIMTKLWRLMLTASLTHTLLLWLQVLYLWRNLNMYIYTSHRLMYEILIVLMVRDLTKVLTCPT